MKPVRWLGSSLDDIRAFPDLARSEAGHQLGRVQEGREPDDWKPMASVGQGVCEIRVRTKQEHRVLYVAKFEEAIFVLHAFEKKTRKTAQIDLDLASRRLSELIQQRQKRK